MKSLQYVQTLAKVLHVLALIGLICSIIGLVGCLVGGCFLIVLPGILGEEIIHMLVDDVPTDTAAIRLGVSLIGEAVFIAAQAVTAYFTYIYLKNELADGTPFTHRGAKELLRLGILNLALPVGAAMIAEIIFAIAGTGNMISNDPDFYAGGIMLVMYLVFRYGADLEDARREAESYAAGIDRASEAVAEATEETNTRELI